MHKESVELASQPLMCWYSPCFLMHRMIELSHRNKEEKNNTYLPFLHSVHAKLDVYQYHYTTLLMLLP